MSIESPSLYQTRSRQRSLPHGVQSRRATPRFQKVNQQRNIRRVRHIGLKQHMTAGVLGHWGVDPQTKETFADHVKRDESLLTETFQAAILVLRKTGRRFQFSPGGQVHCQTASLNYKITITEPSHPMAGANGWLHKFQHRLIIWGPQTTCLEACWNDVNDVYVAAIDQRTPWQQKFLKIARDPRHWHWLLDRNYDSKGWLLPPDPFEEDRERRERVAGLWQKMH